MRRKTRGCLNQPARESPLVPRCLTELAPNRGSRRSQGTRCRCRWRPRRTARQLRGRRLGATRVRQQPGSEHLYCDRSTFIETGQMRGRALTGGCCQSAVRAEWGAVRGRVDRRDGPRPGGRRGGLAGSDSAGRRRFVRAAGGSRPVRRRRDDAGLNRAVDLRCHGCVRPVWRTGGTRDTHPWPVARGVAVLRPLTFLALLLACLVEWT